VSERLNNDQQMPCVIAARALAAATAEVPKQSRAFCLRVTTSSLHHILRRPNYDIFFRCIYIGRLWLTCAGIQMRRYAVVVFNALDNASVSFEDYSIQSSVFGVHKNQSTEALVVSTRCRLGSSRELSNNKRQPLFSQIGVFMSEHIFAFAASML
jgi:hypothetical protein